MTAGATVDQVGRRFLTPGWIFGHLLVVAAVVVCVRLGWWQWDRSEQADGSLQNFAYALLWPAFGAGFIYMWLRFLQLERLKNDADADGGDEPERRPQPEPRPEIAPEREPTNQLDVEEFVGFVPEVDDADDPELAEYNRLLAALAEEDPDRAE